MFPHLHPPLSPKSHLTFSFAGKIRFCTASRGKPDAAFHGLGLIAKHFFTVSVYRFEPRLYLYLSFAFSRLHTYIICLVPPLPAISVISPQAFFSSLCLLQ